MGGLSARILQLRKEAGLTQTELGEKFGVVKSAISHYERGKSIPSDRIKKEMCRFFGVSMDYLLGLSDDRTLSGEEASNLSGMDPAIQEAIQYMEGLSDEAKASALRYLQAIKTLDEMKGSSGEAVIFEKNA